ncbi:hypothetical protein BpHYR1_012563 [Brachionus plicatilis]|uniref:Uncharacterized protein n=1 Tax=Brachionus plicatilis TaxID=10195 RepID=A0A3M7PIV5_BRAPC|nr:hypothetical protein BpHYR1_012563 [Brachionus plicatilis]
MKKKRQIEVSDQILKSKNSSLRLRLKSYLNGILTKYFYRKISGKTLKHHIHLFDYLFFNSFLTDQHKCELIIRSILPCNKSLIQPLNRIKYNSFKTAAKSFK